MFESVVVDLLNRVLGSYIKNLNYSQLQVAVWSGMAWPSFPPPFHFIPHRLLLRLLLGNLVLTNLELRPEALDALNLPITVLRGEVTVSPFFFITLTPSSPFYAAAAAAAWDDDVVIGVVGNLTLNVPWQSLKTKPVVFHLSDVFLLAVPNVQAGYDQKQAELRAQQAKQRKLDELDAFKAGLQAQGGQPGSAGTDSLAFSSSLLTKIVDNLQLVLSNVHIRYEDRYSVAGLPFVFGVTVEKISAESANENWERGDPPPPSFSLLPPASDGLLCVPWSPFCSIRGAFAAGKEVDGALAVCGLLGL